MFSPSSPSVHSGSPGAFVVGMDELRRMFTLAFIPSSLPLLMSGMSWSEEQEAKSIAIITINALNA